MNGEMEDVCCPTCHMGAEWRPCLSATPTNHRPPAGQWEEVSGSAHAPLAMGVMASAATETYSR